MATVVEDVIGEASVNVDSSGVTATRMFIVHELGGSKESRVARALVAPRVPQYGHPHPGLSGVYVTQIAAKLIPNDIDSVMVTITYKTPDSKKGGASNKLKISTGATLQNVQTTFLAPDAQGKQLLLPKVTYKWGAKDGAIRPNGKTDAQGGVVDVMVAVPFVRFIRKEKTHPLDKNIQFCNTVNSATFLGKKTRTWWCSRLDGDSDDEGLTYLVNYEFQYRPEGWDVDMVFIDSATGKPPAGIDDPPGNGVVRGNKIYASQDFSTLNLNLAQVSQVGGLGWVGL